MMNLGEEARETGRKEDVRRVETSKEKREDRPRDSRVVKITLQIRVFKSMEEFPIVMIERAGVTTSKGGEERPLMNEKEKDSHTKTPRLWVFKYMRENQRHSRSR